MHISTFSFQNIYIKLTLETPFIGSKPPDRELIAEAVYKQRTKETYTTGPPSLYFTLANRIE
jgi:hypothetical protein